MNMNSSEYNDYVNRKAPKSPIFTNLIKAFFVGGLICCIGQAFSDMYSSFGMETQEASTAVSITLVFIGALLTGIGVYDNIARFAGAGTLVPITGFANSVVSPALEFKAEGLIPGTAAKAFVISGPVILFGISASVIYGFAYWLFTCVF